jgi:hypothetical protein
MGCFNDSLFSFVSFSGLGTKRILIKQEKIMGEILSVAICCFGITLFGLALGFFFLQVQAKTV